MTASGEQAGPAEAVVAPAGVGALSAAVERALSAVRTIRASGATAREVETVGRSADQAYAAGVRVARLEAVVWPAGSIAVQSAFLAARGTHAELVDSSPLFREPASAQLLL